jgi:hypothetical protein
MKEYYVSRTIKADAETVWALLTDASKYTEWNKSVAKLEGTIEEGKKVKVFATINPKQGFPVTVAELDKPNKMVWLGGMPLGLFKGERTFLLMPKGNGEVEFAMREVFSGLLSPLMAKVIPDLTDSFNEFADCLKAAAEGAISSGG